MSKKYVFPDREKLFEDALVTAQQRLAKGSKRGWTSKKVVWFAFCDGYKLNRSEFSEEKLMLFIEWRNQNWTGGIGRECARGLCYAVRNYALELGKKLDITHTNMPRLHAMMKGLDRIKPSKGGAKAITKDILTKLFETVPANCYDNLVWRSLLSFGHAAIKRASEYTSDEPKLGQLEWNGLNWRLPTRAVSCKFKFYHSKTNQSGLEEEAMLRCECPDICSMHELHRMLSMRRSRAEQDHVFILRNRKVIGYNDLREKLRALCKAAGLNEEDFTSHGLRKGGAQDLLLQGAPSSVIMRQAGWKSVQTMQRYIRNMEGSLAEQHFEHWHLSKTKK